MISMWSMLCRLLDKVLTDAERMQRCLKVVAKLAVTYKWQPTHECEKEE